MHVQSQPSLGSYCHTHGICMCKASPHWGVIATHMAYACAKPALTGELLPHTWHMHMQSQPSLGSYCHTHGICICKASPHWGVIATHVAYAYAKPALTGELLPHTWHMHMQSQPSLGSYCHTHGICMCKASPHWGVIATHMAYACAKPALTGELLPHTWHMHMQSQPSLGSYCHTHGICMCKASPHWGVIATHMAYACAKPALTGELLPHTWHMHMQSQPSLGSYCHTHGICMCKASPHWGVIATHMAYACAKPALTGELLPHTWHMHHCKASPHWGVIATHMAYACAKPALTGELLPHTWHMHVQSQPSLGSYCHTHGICMCKASPHWGVIATHVAYAYAKPALTGELLPHTWHMHMQSQPSLGSYCHTHGICMCKASPHWGVIATHVAYAYAKLALTGELLPHTWHMHVQSQPSLGSYCHTHGICICKASPHWGVIATHMAYAYAKPALTGELLPHTWHMHMQSQPSLGSYCHTHGICICKASPHWGVIATHVAYAYAKPALTGELLPHTWHMHMQSQPSLGSYCHTHGICICKASPHWGVIATHMAYACAKLALTGELLPHTWHMHVQSQPSLGSYCHTHGICMCKASPHWGVIAAHMAYACAKPALTGELLPHTWHMHVQSQPSLGSYCHTRGICICKASPHWGVIAAHMAYAKPALTGELLPHTWHMHVCIYVYIHRMMNGSFRVISVVLVCAELQGHICGVGLCWASGSYLWCWSVLSFRVISVVLVCAELQGHICGVCLCWASGSYQWCLSVLSFRVISVVFVCAELQDHICGVCLCWASGSYLWCLSVLSFRVISVVFVCAELQGHICGVGLCWASGSYLWCWSVLSFRVISVVFVCAELQGHICGVCLCWASGSYLWCLSVLSFRVISVVLVCAELQGHICGVCLCWASGSYLWCWSVLSFRVISVVFVCAELQGHICGVCLCWASGSYLWCLPVLSFRIISVVFVCAELQIISVVFVCAELQGHICGVCLCWASGSYLWCLSVLRFRVISVVFVCAELQDHICGVCLCWALGSYLWCLSVLSFRVISVVFVCAELQGHICGVGLCWASGSYLWCLSVLSFRVISVVLVCAELQDHICGICLCWASGSYLWCLSVLSFRVISVVFVCAELQGHICGVCLCWASGSYLWCLSVLSFRIISVVFVCAELQGHICGVCLCWASGSYLWCLSVLSFRVISVVFVCAELQGHICGVCLCWASGSYLWCLSVLSFRVISVVLVYAELQGHICGVCVCWASGSSPSLNWEMVVIVKIKLWRTAAEVKVEECWTDCMVN